MANIPEGYTYTRCDQYTADEFLGMFQSDSMRRIVGDYIQTHPKDRYNTDDEIAVHQIHDGLVANSLHDVTHSNTTKRYRYTSH